MSDGISKDEMRELFKEFFGGKAGATIDPKSAKTLEELVKQYDKFTKSIVDQGKKYTLLGQALQKNVTASQQVKEELDELDETIKNTNDAYDRSILQQKRRDIEMAASHNTQKQMLFQFGQNLLRIGSTAFAGAGQFVKGLQSGSTGIDLAAGLMNTSLDVAGQTSQAMGQAAGTAGQIMMNSTNPRLKTLGAIAAVVGPALGSLGEGASKLAKFGVEVLQKEVEKTVKAFHTATASGAVFADGMTGLRNAANSAGLTVDQFAAVLQQHSTDLAALGMSVTEGAKKVGAALNAGGPQMKASLQKLGYGFEEQAGLVAETMRDMRGSGGPLRASNAQVAAETQKYAENLRTISAITGEDAKKKMEQVRNQASQLAFQQKLAGMDETQRKGIINAMANMTDIERKNFMDMVNFGTVINKEGATAAAVSGGLTNTVNASYKAFQQGKLDEIEQRRIAKQYGAQVKQDMLDNTAIATAGAAGVGGLVQSLSESMGKELEARNKMTPEAIAAAEEGVAAQKEANDKLTESVVGAEQAAQNLKLALEKELTPAIGRFAEVAKEMLAGVQKMMKEAGIGEGPGGKPKEKGVLEDVGKDVTKVGLGATLLGGALTGLGALASATGVGAAAGVPMMAAGTAMMSGGAATMTVGSVLDMIGFAEGGIAVGDPKGYMAKLHGTELIVPMNGKELDESSKGFEDLMGMYMKQVKRGPDMSMPTAMMGTPGSGDFMSRGFDSVLNQNDIMSGISSMMSTINSPMAAISDMMTQFTENKLPSVGLPKEVTEAMGTEMGKALADLQSLTKEQIDKHDQMLKVLTEHKDISNQLLNNSY